MARQAKRSGNKKTLDCLASYKRIRKDWGDVRPGTLIEKDQKKYNRKKEKQHWRKELDGSI